MSRINDALKRAQNAQHNAPAPSSVPQLPPPAPEQAAMGGIGQALAIVFVVIVFVGLLFGWQLRQRRDRTATVPGRSDVTMSGAAAYQAAETSTSLRPGTGAVQAGGGVPRCFPSPLLPWRKLSSQPCKLKSSPRPNR